MPGGTPPYRQPWHGRMDVLPLAAASLEIFEAIEDPNAEMVRRALQEWRGG